MRKNSNLNKVLGLNTERPLFVPSTSQPPRTLSRWGISVLFGTLGYLLGGGLMCWVYAGHGQNRAAEMVLLIFVCPGIGVYAWVMAYAAYLGIRHQRWTNRETNFALDIIKEQYGGGKSADKGRSVVEALLLSYSPEDKE